jgi:hypothetical protein
MARVWRIFWPVARQVLGWMFIVLGLLGLVLPLLQGVLFLVIGIALVGRRNIVIRHSRVAIRRFLRRWAAVQAPVIGPAGRLAHRAHRQSARQSRHLHHRYDAWVRRHFRRAPASPPEAPLEGRYDRRPDRV